VPSERRSIEEQLIGYCGWACCLVTVRGDLRDLIPALKG
jgi:hypothetical protein